MENDDQYVARLVQGLKDKHEIQTHFCEDQKWMALSMSAARELLSGEELDEETSSDLSAMVSAYGQLLDESGLLMDGFTSEAMAVALAALAAETRAVERAWGKFKPNDIITLQTTGLRWQWRRGDATAMSPEFFSREEAEEYQRRNPLLEQ